jgi:creatinine amidohydrolase
VRKLVIVNSHGGNEAVMDIVARELRVRHAMLAVKTSWMRFGTPPGLYGEGETKYGIHGGDVETSLMLHFKPHTVDMAQARDFRSKVEAAHGRFGLLAHTGTHAFGWIASDLNPEGAVGEAHLATAAKGAALARHQAQGFIDLLRDVERMDLDSFGDFSRPPTG